jgi:membrane associated rhomboid family serine protease
MKTNCWGCGKPIEVEGNERRCPECREKFEKETKKHNEKATELDTCPHCGAIRNKFSDAQKCFSCGKFYFTGRGGLKKIFKRKPTRGFAYLDESAPKSKPYITVILMFVNTIIFALMYLDGYTANPIDVAIKYGAQYTDAVLTGEWWRLASSWFVHFGLLHFSMNMASLWIIGSNVEGEIGSIKFVIAYVLSGLGGSAASLYSSPYAVSAGASGAVCGIIGFAYLYSTIKRSSVGNFNSQSLLSWIVMIQVYGFLMPNIGWEAHLGGLIAGGLVGALFAKFEKRR